MKESNKRDRNVSPTSTPLSSPPTKRVHQSLELEEECSMDIDSRNSRNLVEDSFEKPNKETGVVIEEMLVRCWHQKKISCWIFEFFRN